jgi:hypothetical protein
MDTHYPVPRNVEASEVKKVLEKTSRDTMVFYMCMCNAEDIRS